MSKSNQNALAEILAATVFGDDERLRRGWDAVQVESCMTIEESARRAKAWAIRQARARVGVTPAATWPAHVKSAAVEHEHEQHGMIFDARLPREYLQRAWDYVRDECIAAEEL